MYYAGFIVMPAAGHIRSACMHVESNISIIICRIIVIIILLLYLLFVHVTRTVELGFHEITASIC